jgi:hypothetical protein
MGPERYRAGEGIVLVRRERPTDDSSSTTAQEPVNDRAIVRFIRLGRQAFCQGDWIDAGLKLIDLAGEGDLVEAQFLDEADIGIAPDTLLTSYVKTYTEAKKIADQERAKRPKRQPVRSPMDDLFESR